MLNETCAVALERLEPIARRHAKGLHARRGIHEIQLASDGGPQALRNLSSCFAVRTVEDILGLTAVDASGPMYAR